MFDEDDLSGGKKSQHSFPRNLENLSIEELHSYIQDMKEEIQRVEQDIKNKKATQQAAASVFK